MSETAPQAEVSEIEAEGQHVQVVCTDDEGKAFAQPTCSPEELADLVSCLPNQQKAEIVYELVLFAAMAAEETCHPALNEFLAELEDLAIVYDDPERRSELRKTVQEALAVFHPTGGATEGPSARQTPA